MPLTRVQQDSVVSERLLKLFLNAISLADIRYTCILVLETFFLHFLTESRSNTGSKEIETQMLSWTPWRL